ncbi:hypothetical protein MMC30_002148 [Trapelia coarctata]|nr:hypothetical protein [Trapelia coarctata]
MSTKALPSEEEILRGRKLGGSVKADLYVLEDNLVAKKNHWFKDHSHREFKNINFVKANTTISVPEVHGVVDSKDGKTAWLIMDYIPGESLRSLWKGLKEDERSEIAEILEEWFTQLHTIPPPSPPYFGSLDGEPLPPDIFCLPPREGLNRRAKEPPMAPDGSGPLPEPWFDRNGPFFSQEEYNKALYLRANEWDSCQWGILDHLMDTHWKGHQPVFTHGDISRGNIMVERITKDTRTSGDSPRFKVTLIDWEGAAWYPEYHDFCYPMVTYCNGRNWRNILARILRPYWEQAATFHYASESLFQSTRRGDFCGDRPEPTPYTGFDDE